MIWLVWISLISIWFHGILLVSGIGSFWLYSCSFGFNMATFNDFHVSTLLDLTLDGGVLNFLFNFSPKWISGGSDFCKLRRSFYSHSAPRITSAIFPHNLCNLDHFLRTHRSPITTLIINAMMTLVKIITMMNKDHKDHMKCQITWNINWHKLSNDMEYQMTWNLKWNEICNDMKSQKTWNLKWF